MPKVQRFFLEIKRTQNTNQVPILSKKIEVYLDKENHLLTTSNRIKSKNINSKLMHNLYFIRVFYSRIYNFFKISIIVNCIKFFFPN